MVPEVCTLLHSFCPSYPSALYFFCVQESFEIASGNKANHIDPKMPRFWRTTIAAKSGRRAFEGLVCSLYRIASSSTPSREDIRYDVVFGKCMYTFDENPNPRHAGPSLQQEEGQ
jgi:hypothetical protein